MVDRGVVVGGTIAIWGSLSFAKWKLVLCGYAWLHSSYLSSPPIHYVYLCFVRIRLVRILETAAPS
jgi:hypothetical protein